MASPQDVVRIGSIPGHMRLLAQQSQRSTRLGPATEDGYEVAHNWLWLYTLYIHYMRHDIYIYTHTIYIYITYIYTIHIYIYICMYTFLSAKRYVYVLVGIWRILNALTRTQRHRMASEGKHLQKGLYFEQFWLPSVRISCIVCHPYGSLKHPCWPKGTTMLMWGSSRSAFAKLPHRTFCDRTAWGACLNRFVRCSVGSRQTTANLLVWILNPYFQHSLETMV